MGGSADSAARADLGSFVPRLVAEWVAETPKARHRRITGSMVFTDLSGFTAMSEKLAGLGKVGAEELTHHLDSVFTELLEVAAGYGASLLKFGGDALLLFLWGDQHELRAAAAAAGAQSRLSKVGRIRTGAGQIRLTMTVGAHAGDFDFFLVGRSHRELLVSGAAATRTVALESSARPGQVIVSGAISRAVRRHDPGALGPRRGRGVLLTRAPKGVPAGEAVEGDWAHQLELDRFVPVLLREEVAGGVVLPEHRQMVVGFCHLANVDDLLASEGPSATADALEHLITSMQHICAEHGVCFVSSDVYDDGPKIICSTGVVRSWENDDERLLRALRDVLDLDTPILLRAGVHRGHGFRGAIGPPWRRTFAVMGDMVNTAARVMAKAAPGELLATQAPLDHSDTLFATEELPPFAAKGKSQPLVALRVGDITGMREPMVDRHIPLLGREQELGELREAVSSAIAGTGQAVEVVGDAGIGKTRLVDELAESFDVVRVVRVQCGPYSQATAYLPLRVLMADLVGELSVEALRRTVAERARDLAKWLPFLGVVMGFDLPATPATEAIDPQFARAQLQRAVGELVEAVMSAPTVWVVEDLHWADEATLELLSTLVPRLADLPLALVTTSRTDTDLDVAARIQVAPLGHEAAAALITAVSPRPLLPQQVQALAERAAGNPLFLQELAAALEDGSGLDEVPESVEALIAARLDALSTTDRRLVRELAVLGANTHRDTARAVAVDVPEPDEKVRWQRLEPFVQAAGDRIQFRHALVRDVAYGGLSFKERKAVHLAAGRYLETLPDPDQHAALLAQHFHLGGDPERALQYSVVAAEQAEAAFAYLSAARLWGWAANSSEMAEHRSELSRLIGRQGDALRLSGEYEAAREAFKRARRRTAHPVERATLASKLVGIAQLLGDESMRSSWDARVVAELEACDETTATTSLRANVELDRSIASFQYGDFVAALTHVDRAREAAERCGDREGLTRCLVQRFRVLARLRHVDASDAAERALQIARATAYARAEAVVLSSRAQLHFDQGAWADAINDYELALRLYEDTGDVINLAVTRGNLAELLLEQGDAQVAIEHLRSAVATAEASGTWVRHTIASYLGWALVRAGAATEGLRILHSAVASLHGLGMADDHARASAWLAWGLLEEGRPEEASRVLTLLPASEHAQSAFLQRVKARCSIAAGSIDDAASALRTAIRAANGRREEHEWARAVLELHALSPQPAGDVEEAYATLDRLGIPYEREEAPVS